MRVMIVKGKRLTVVILAVVGAVLLGLLCLRIPGALSASAGMKYRPIAQVETGEKVVAITIDGSENCWYLDTFCGYLQRYEVKATFFVTGNYAKEYERNLDRLHTDGHSVQSLGLKNKDLATLTLSQLTEDVKAAATMIGEHCWRAPTLVRCMNPKITSDGVSALQSCGFQVIGAALDSGSFSSLAGEPLGEKMADQVTPGAIVRFRLDVEGDSAAMDRFINKITAQGYRVIPLEELLAVQKTSE